MINFPLISSSHAKEGKKVFPLCKSALLRMPRASFDVLEQDGWKCSSYMVINCLEYMNYSRNPHLEHLKKFLGWNEDVKKLLLKDALNTVSKALYTNSVQNNKIRSFFKNLLIPTQITKNKSEIIHHLKSGNPALLTIEMRWDSDGPFHWIRAADYRFPEILQEYVPGKGTYHGVVAINYLDKADYEYLDTNYYIIADSQTGKVSAFSEKDVHKYMYGSQILVGTE